MTTTPDGLFQSAMADIDLIINSCNTRADSLPNGQPKLKLLRVLGKMNRAKQEFYAEVFFVACFGMLKSGKSTLVNLLCGHPNASPTGQGIDTTLRPCLILKRDHEGIAIYYPAADTDDSSQLKECFDMVVSHLKGLTPESDLTNAAGIGVLKKQCELSPKDIHKALCGPPITPREPLITVVSVSTPMAFGDDVALLDLPGLDSTISDWTRHGWYHWILQRCDFLLLAQSTLAPLNLPAEQVLKEILEKSKQPPVWLIHNTIEAKHWVDPVVTRDLATTQKQDARKHVAARVGRTSIPATDCNLGKAFDATFETGFPQELRDQLMSESGFVDLKTALRADLGANRGRIVKENSMKELLRVTKDGGEEIKALIADLHAQFQENVAFTAKLDSSTGILRGTDYRLAIATVEGELTDGFEASGRAHQVALASQKNQLDHSLDMKLTGEEFNNRVQKHIESILGVNGNCPLIDGMWTAHINVLLPSANQKISDVETRGFDQIKESLATHPFVAQRVMRHFLSSKFKLDRTEFPPPPTVTPKQLKEKVFGIPLWKKEFDANATSHARTSLNLDITTAVTTYWQQAAVNLSQHVLTRKMDERLTDLLKKLEECVAEEKLTIQQNQQELEAQMATLRELNTEVDRVLTHAGSLLHRIN